MRLSKYPEGVWYLAGTYNNPNRHVVRRVGNSVFYVGGGCVLSNHPACEWTVIERIAAVETQDAETLQARIAELESKLAKATRPEPAVGQVWKRGSLSEYLIIGGGYLYPDGSVIDCANPSEYTAGDTYVGAWDGVFNVKEEI